MDLIAYEEEVERLRPSVEKRFKAHGCELATCRAVGPYERTSVPTLMMGVMLPEWHRRANPPEKHYIGSCYRLPDGVDAVASTIEKLVVNIETMMIDEGIIKEVAS